MSLESATFIDDLDATNPTATDSKSQGDDHLRLLKTVLKASIKRVTRAFYVPGSSAKTADFTIAASGDNITYTVDTTLGTVTATLPTLVSADAGWECSFIKTNTGTSPLFIAPASGTIQSGEVAALAKTRRCIPGHKTRVFWTGSSWFAERVVRSPVGSIITMAVAGLPVGYEWPNGQTLSGTAGSVYPDYYVANSSSLVTIDHRGRAAFGTDTLGTGPAGRITDALSSIVGATFAATGGTESFTIAAANLPNNTLTVAIAAGQGSHTHASGNLYYQAGGANVAGSPANHAHEALGGGTITAATLPAMIGTTSSINGGVTQTTISKMPPTIMLNKVLVVE